MKLHLASLFLSNWSNLFHRIEPTFYLFWKNNFDGFNRCFNRLQESVSKPLRKTLKSGPLTREKKDPKEHTDIAVSQPKVSEDLAKLEELKLHIQKFTAQKEDIISSRNFSFTIEEIKQTKEPLNKEGMHMMNCLQCFSTCHDNCSIADDDGIIRCVAMRDGYCTVCTGHCTWSVHKTRHIYTVTLSLR